MQPLIITLFNEFRYISELIIAAFLLLLPAARRRPHFHIRLVGGILLCIFTPFLFLILQKLTNLLPDFYTYASYYLWYVLLVILASVHIYVCFAVNLTELFWYISMAFCMQHLVYVINNELLFMNLDYTAILTNPPLYISVSLFSCAVIYAIIYLIFRSRISREENLTFEDTGKTRLVLGAMFALLIIQSFFNQYNAIQSFNSLNLISVLSDLINCIVLLMLSYSMLKNNAITFHTRLAVELNRNLSAQYDSFRASVDYLNIKIHDLKHEIGHLSAEKLLTQETLNQLQENISLYEAFSNTGNYTLDTILTEKHIACLNHNIAFSHMAEGNCLAFMEESDIYILFANMLDNAIEHVQDLPVEQRYIRLVIRAAGQMILIHQENYFSGELTLQNGLPVTSKTDRFYHGFGTKSMQSIAGKYHGELKFQAEGNTFFVDILIPGQG